MQQRHIVTVLLAVLFVVGLVYMATRMSWLLVENRRLQSELQREQGAFERVTKELRDEIKVHVERRHELAEELRIAKRRNVVIQPSLGSRYPTADYPIHRDGDEETFLKDGKRPTPNGWLTPEQIDLMRRIQEINQKRDEP